MFLVKALKRGKDVQEIVQMELQAERIIGLGKVLDHNVGLSVGTLASELRGAKINTRLMKADAGPSPWPSEELCKSFWTELHWNSQPI